MVRAAESTAGRWFESSFRIYGALYGEGHPGTFSTA